MYCHNKYDCAALDTAAKAYLAWAQGQENIEVLLKVFKASARFDLAESYDCCGRTLARVLPTLAR